MVVCYEKERVAIDDQGKRQGDQTNPGEKENGRKEKDRPPEQNR
jgi:hypothetical protein